ncbi:MAG: YigZ family protein [Clostridium sp.]|nr:YigZ family protein [Clostridium sp.]
MSKFLAFAIPVGSAAEAKEQIAIKQNEYHDARHVCWAYMVGPRRLEYLSSDNGEPSGTAGKPILGQINSFSLTDIVIIVVRYFGGIKLGTSGLIGAYREAARLAIEDGEIIECREKKRIKLTFPYLAMNDVMRIAKMPCVKIISQEFDNTCRMELETNLDDAPRVEGLLGGASGVSLLG